MIAHDLWHVQIPVLEKIIRTVAVYGGLAVLLRLAGKRDLAQLNSFDLALFHHALGNARRGARERTITDLLLLPEMI